MGEGRKRREGGRPYLESEGLAEAPLKGPFHVHMVKARTPTIGELYINHQLVLAISSCGPNTHTNRQNGPFPAS